SLLQSRQGLMSENVLWIDRQGGFEPHLREVESIQFAGDLSQLISQVGILHIGECLLMESGEFLPASLEMLETRRLNLGLGRTFEAAIDTRQLVSRFEI